MNRINELGRMVALCMGAILMGSIAAYIAMMMGVVP